MELYYKLRTIIRKHVLIYACYFFSILIYIYKIHIQNSWVSPSRKFVFIPHCLWFDCWGRKRKKKKKWPFTKLCAFLYRNSEMYSFSNWPNEFSFNVESMYNVHILLYFFCASKSYKIFCHKRNKTSPLLFVLLKFDKKI